MNLQKKKKKYKLITTVVGSVSVLLAVTFTVVLSVFELYRNCYLIPSYIQIIQEEDAICDETLSDCFYSVAMLKSQVFKASNLTRLKESDDPKADLISIVGFNGLNTDLFCDVGYLYENRYYGYYSDTLYFAATDLEKIQSDNQISVLKTLPYNGAYAILTAIRHDDIVSFYFLREDALSLLIEDNQRNGFKVVAVNGTYVFISKDEYLLGKDVLDLKSFENRHFVTTFNQQKYYLINSRLENLSGYGSEIYITTFIDYDYMFSDINRLEIALLSLSGCTLILTLILTAFLTFKIVRPINQLSVQVGEEDIGTIDIRALKKKESKNEIYILEKSYANLIDRIRNLLNKQLLDSEKQRKLELDSLQVQINPHFLYNALDSIAWMAKIDKEKPIEEFVIALAKFYRLSLHKGEKYILIREEMDIIKYYLEIQLKRFPETFTFDLQIDERITVQKTLKLILQPFVENIIKHAFNEMNDIGKILVKAELDGAFIRFTICDNGCGFDTRVLKTKKDSPGGYGIRNVIERLKLEYKNDFSYTVHSVIGQGTTVVIRIPDLSASARSETPAGE